MMARVSPPRRCGRVVGKHDVVGTARSVCLSKETGHATGMDVGQEGEAAAMEVAPQDPERPRVRLHECYSMGTAAKGFDPDGSGSSIEIQHACPNNASSQDRKQRLSHSVW